MRIPGLYTFVQYLWPNRSVVNQSLNGASAAQGLKTTEPDPASREIKKQIGTLLRQYVNAPEGIPKHLKVFKVKNGELIYCNCSGCKGSKFLPNSRYLLENLNTGSKTHFFYSETHELRDGGFRSKTLVRRLQEMAGLHTPRWIKMGRILGLIE